MDKVAVIQAIERLRRAMPRNPDAMMICDAAQACLTESETKKLFRTWGHAGPSDPKPEKRR